MKRYYKEENGKKVWFGGVLKLDGKQVINPSEEMILADGWTEFVAVVHVPTEEEILRERIESKLAELHSYDESDEVNDCIVVKDGVEMHYWANKTERDSLKGALRDCISMGRETYRLDLRSLGVSLVVPCETLLQMLAALEVYAIDCYNKTTDHEFAIKAFTDLEELEEYDFKTGYPEKLTFNL